MSKVTVEGEVRIPVIFETSMAPYNPGEQAGFEENYAHKLVKAGYARYADPNDDPSPVVIPEVQVAEKSDEGGKSDAQAVDGEAKSDAKVEAKADDKGEGKGEGHGPKGNHRGKGHRE